MASSTFYVDKVVDLGDGRKAAVTNKKRNELSFVFCAGERLQLRNVIHEEAEFQVLNLIQFAPSKVTDRFIFEIPAGARSDLTGWHGRKKT
ncbi:MAG: hypothetical protein JNL98_06835 [Bryobacterales bacterium]|nr:hypothetical protein [Bryobacterales bacterium]